MAAACFHCSSGDPVGVCERCNVFACSTDGNRPRVFQCVTCGAQTTAAAAVVQSDAGAVNALARAVVSEALRPGEVADDLRVITLASILASGFVLRRRPDDPEPDTPDAIWAAIHRLEEAIGEVVAHSKLRSVADRAHSLRQSLPDVWLWAVGVGSWEDVALQAAEIWNLLHPGAQRLLAVAVLVHQRTRPQSWSPAVAILRYSLDPDPEELPRLG